MSQITNLDIMEKLGSIEARLVAVQAQAEKTNGRVTKAEEFINALKAVEIYKKDNPQATTIQNIKADTVNMRQPWYMNEKFVGAIVGIILAVLTVLSFVIKGGAQ